MKDVSTSEYVPLIELFKTQVRKAFLTQAVIIKLIFFMLFLAIFALVCALDAVAAVSLASLVLLVFLFYVIHLYFKESLFQKAIETKNRIEEATEKLSLDPTEKAELFSRLALSTHFIPVSLVHFPHHFTFLEPFINRFLTFITWLPLHTMGEVLFLAAIDEHVQQIKKDPVNLPLHAALANCYVMLSHHYQEPLKAKPLLSWPGILLTETTRATLGLKAEMSSKNALEELTILQAFAPDELWVHDQLAISYKELKMTEKEIEECEAILRLCPDDHQAKLRLGILYFSLGKNAKGLEIYEQLKTVQPLLAEELIEQYGVYTPVLKHL